MKQPTLIFVKKVVSAIKSKKKKYITCEMISKDLGIYPEVIADNLSFFDAMVSLDYEYDIRTLLSDLEQYINSYHANKSTKKNATRTTKLDDDVTIGSFIYDKFTLPGGIIDSSVKLTTAELKQLKTLILKELKK